MEKMYKIIEMYEMTVITIRFGTQRTDWTETVQDRGLN